MPASPIPGCRTGVWAENYTDAGTLVAQAGATELPLQAFGLPLENAVAHIGRDRFYVPGALLRVQVDIDPQSFL